MVGERAWSDRQADGSVAAVMVPSEKKFLRCRRNAGKEKTMSVGKRVFTKINRPDPELVERFWGLPSSNINDEMNRLYCMHDYIHLLNPGKCRKMVGTAVTVKVPIGDNLYIHEAIDRAQPGDILVIDGGSGNNRSLAGELMMRFAAMKGVVGIVADGCLRDLEGIMDLEMPVYAKGFTPQGPFKNGPGEVNVPVAVGGQVIFPGDILVGDLDGVVVVRKEDAEEVLASALKKNVEEEQAFSLMKSDPEAYAEKHRATTEKRKEGRGMEYVEASYMECYQI